MNKTNQKKFLGEFEELVLLAVMKLGNNDAYGVSIADAIEGATSKRVSIGALYTTLSRLEEKGFVASRMGEATEERGGRAKKFYKIEALGEQILRETNKVRLKFYEEVVPQFT
jgi:PadR family transcriptional regulator, regulatory protein PadR